MNGRSMKYSPIIPTTFKAIAEALVIHVFMVRKNASNIRFLPCAVCVRA